MEKNEIKKLLYKDKPTADLQEVRRDGIVYTTFVSTGAVDKNGVGYTDDIVKAYFLIPLGEVGEVIWEKQMPAKLLIRWLQD